MAWRDLEDERAALGLPAADAELVVRGRDVAELCPGWSALLAAIGPASTAGHAGWLAADDVQRCRRAIARAGDGGPASLRTALRDMLAADAPLCVIVSG